MAGTRFIQSTLANEVEGNYNRRIAEVQDELAELSQLTTDGQHAAWRATAESDVAELYERIVEGDVSDVELTKFSIPYPPDPFGDDWKRERLQRQIADLEKARDKALAYIRSLAPVSTINDDGTITDHVVEVSAVDLKRIGYGV